MTDGQFFDALGAGWLGKVIAAVVAFAIAWFTRRPIAEAAVMERVNERLEMVMTAMKADNDALREDLRRERAECDRQLADLRGEIAAMKRGRPK